MVLTNLHNRPSDKNKRKRKVVLQLQVRQSAAAVGFSLTTCEELILPNGQALPGYDKYTFIKEMFEPRIAWKEIIANIDKAGQCVTMATRIPSLDPPVLGQPQRALES